MFCVHCQRSACPARWVSTSRVSGTSSASDQLCICASSTSLPARPCPAIAGFPCGHDRLAKPFVVVAPIEVQFVEQGDVGGCIDGIELAAERCA